MRFKRYPKIKPKDESILAMQARIDAQTDLVSRMVYVSRTSEIKNKAQWSSMIEEEAAEEQRILAEYNAKYTKYEQQVGRTYTAEIAADAAVKKANQYNQIDAEYVAKAGEKEKLEEKIEWYEFRISGMESYIEHTNFYDKSDEAIEALEWRVDIAAFKIGLAGIVIEYHRKFSRKAVAAQLKVQLSKIADKLKK